MYNFLFVLGSSGEQVSKACCHAQGVSARRPDYSSWIVLCFDTKKKVTGIPCMHPIYILSHVFNWKAVVRGGVCVWGGSFHSIFERQQISWINTESEYQSQSQFKENFFSSFLFCIYSLTKFWNLCCKLADATFQVPKGQECSQKAVWKVYRPNSFL